MKTLADRVQRRLDDLGWIQDDLAKRVGVSQTAIFKITSGKTLKPRNILDISRALGVTPEWLEKGEGAEDFTDTNALAMELTEEEKRILWNIRHRMTLEQKKDLLEQTDKIAQKNEEIFNELTSIKFKKTG